VSWSDAKVQAKAKQGSECWGWFGCVGEIVNGKIVWPLEVIPGRHVSEGKSGVFFDRLCFVGDEAVLTDNLHPGVL
jgi:hypothetical protein